ncbi:MAG: hypothetical protein EAX95_13260 [Candidatus Thorarchaeota archaeon]|nr:hypothetical protein [Candidatus Thorarchaeota archaeon]
MILSAEDKQEAFVGEREKLIVSIHRKRAGFIFYYVFATVVFIVGTGFMVSVAGRVVPYDELAWWFGISAMFFGLGLFIGTEVRRQYTMYIVTTWNVRVQKGFFGKITNRVFFDDIVMVESSLVPAVRPLSMGSVYIYTAEERDKPALVFNDIYNPVGIRDLIIRIQRTTPEVVPWSHIEKTREVRY